MTMLPKEILQEEKKLGTDFLVGDVIEIKGITYLITKIDLPGQITAKQLLRPTSRLIVSEKHTRYALGTKNYTSKTGLAKEWKQQESAE